MLVERGAGFGIGGVGGGIPDNLVDRDGIPGFLQTHFVRSQVVQCDEKDSRRQRGSVDRPGKRHGDSRLNVESVKLVDEAEFGAEGHLCRAIRQRQVHALAGDLGGVGNGEGIRRVWSGLRIVRIETRRPPGAITQSA